MIAAVVLVQSGGLVARRETFLIDPDTQKPAWAFATLEYEYAREAAGWLALMAEFGLSQHDVKKVVIDENVIENAMKTVERKGVGNKRPAYFKDIRKMLEDKSIDAVTIATTNHTHALYAIWAMQAGKDVYKTRSEREATQRERVVARLLASHARNCRAPHGPSRMRTRRSRTAAF